MNRWKTIFLVPHQKKEKNLYQAGIEEKTKQTKKTSAAFSWNLFLCSYHCRYIATVLMFELQLRFLSNEDKQSKIKFIFT